MTIDGMPFELIDRIVAGRGFVDPSIATSIETLQSAVSSRRPLCLGIAQSLRRLPAGSHVLLFTGFVVADRMPRGENDGPLGTVVLGRALQRLGLHPEVWSDPEVLDTMRWLSAECRADLPIFPIDRSRLRARMPSAAIAIEKPGRNGKGVMHTFDGLAIENGSISVDELFRAWMANGVLTVGIGDRGNEVGFGSIAGVVRAIHPHAARCRCGCAGGVVADTSSELLLPSAVSNWGAYGIAASLALLTDDPGCSVTVTEEARMLRTAAVRGCVDGVHRRGLFSVDAISGAVCLDVVRDLERLVALTRGSRDIEDACA